MKYVILMYGDESVWRDADDATRDRILAAHEAVSAALKAGPVKLLGGEALEEGHTATTVRVDESGKQVLTDGPFAETVEQLGGFYLVDAPSLDDVVALVDLLPCYYINEIRPVADFS